jgi:hypothetical protein
MIGGRRCGSGQSRGSRGSWLEWRWSGGCRRRVPRLPRSW